VALVAAAQVVIMIVLVVLLDYQIPVEAEEAADILPV
jgi:hypothetical protein